MALRESTMVRMPVYDGPTTTTNVRNAICWEEQLREQRERAREREREGENQELHF